MKGSVFNIDRKIYSKIFLWVFFVSCLGAFSPLMGQTYTYNPTKSGCDQTWTNGDCWDKVDAVGCNASNQSASLFPPLVNVNNLPAPNTYNNSCIVEVIINDNLDLDPGFDFAFLGSIYKISLAENINLNIVNRHLHLLERADLEINNASGTGNVNFMLYKNLYYSKQAKLFIRDGVTLETNNILNPGTSQIEGVNITIDPLAVVRVGNTVAFTNSNSNKIFVDGTFEFRNLLLGSGHPGTSASDIDKKNQLVVRGSGRANSCTSVVIDGDSYATVEDGGVLNLISLTMSGRGMFDNYGEAYFQNITVSGDPIFRMYAGSNVYNENYLKISGNAKFVKCGTEYTAPTTGIGLCGSETFHTETDNELWDAVTGEWCARLLPVILVYEELIYDRVHNKILLNWSTAKEWENSHFEIERAISAELDFQKVGEVTGMGWSDSVTDYVFEDDPPFMADRVYYRVKQVDFDGTFEYGKVMSVEIPGNDSLCEGVWRVYPNPLRGNGLSLALLKTEAYNNEPVQFRLLHNFSRNKSFNAESIGEADGVLKRLIDYIPIGITVLEIRWGDQTEYIKLLRK